MKRFLAVWFFAIVVLPMLAQNTEFAASGKLTVNAEPGLDNLLILYKKSNDGKPIPGYRIQIFSGKRQASFDLKAEVLKQFPQLECNVVYEVPDYKVHIGNYRTKMEAEKALSELWSYYKSAFYVKTQIDLPRLPIEQ